MKKYAQSAMLVLAIFIASCGKENNTVTGNGGSWQFKGVNYNAVTTNVSAGAAGNSFYGYTGNGYTSGEGTLSIQFYGSTTQGVLVPGTYTIAHQVPPDTNQVYIVINTGGDSSMVYGSTVGLAGETITLTTVNGKYNITGQGIKLQNLSSTNYADSNSTITLNVKQQ